MSNIRYIVLKGLDCVHVDNDILKAEQVYNRYLRNYPDSVIQLKQERILKQSTTARDVYSGKYNGLYKSE